jgi:undecaprenyl-diphosphatase
LITTVQAVIQGIVEGITEFLPVSSTGHLIVSSAALHMPNDAANKAFEIVIQLGAIIAVIVFYRDELLEQLRMAATEPRVRRFYLNLFIAFFPVALVGLLAHHWIEDHLFSPRFVAASLIVGGLVLILTDRKGDEEEAAVADVYDLMPRHALFIGIAQIFALLPGTSRSAATIIGGMMAGLDRKTATRFSFFLAIPTLGIATLYALFKARHDISHGSDIAAFGIGTLVSFVVAWACIGWLLRYISRHSFFSFGVYRIMAGLAIFGLAYSGFF